MSFEHIDERIKTAERKGREADITITRRVGAWDVKVVVRNAKGLELANRRGGASTYDGAQTALMKLLETLP